MKKLSTSLLVFAFLVTLLTFTVQAKNTVTLSRSTYTYNAQQHTPSVTVKNSSGKRLKQGTDYTLSYSKGRTAVGTYSITVKFKGDYSGQKTVKYKILPKSVQFKTIIAGDGRVALRWNQQTTQTDGYIIHYSEDPTFEDYEKVTIRNNKTTTKTVTDLDGNTKYYFRIRTFKETDSGKVYSEWSDVLNIKTISSADNTYYINGSSGTIHLKSCSATDKISDTNKMQIKSTLKSLKKQGLSPCSRCIGG